MVSNHTTLWRVAIQPNWSATKVATWKTKERPWTMSENVKPFEPQCRVHNPQPNHNTTKTQTHDNQTIGANCQNKERYKGTQQEPHQRDTIGGVLIKLWNVLIKNIPSQQHTALTVLRLEDDNDTVSNEEDTS